MFSLYMINHNVKLLNNNLMIKVKTHQGLIILNCFHNLFNEVVLTEHRLLAKQKGNILIKVKMKTKLHFNWKVDRSFKRKHYLKFRRNKELLN